MLLERRTVAALNLVVPIPAFGVGHVVEHVGKLECALPIMRIERFLGFFHVEQLCRLGNLALKPISLGFEKKVCRPLHLRARHERRHMLHIRQAAFVLFDQNINGVIVGRREEGRFVNGF
ncbi:hypothetical protein [Salinisphaera sp. T31B1]|uniref:hypothetical protein n=1 Tax=Salinisphaera sp. T31B1 TaxID=727963 RepID=UPI00333EF74F